MKTLITAQKVNCQHSDCDKCHHLDIDETSKNPFFCILFDMELFKDSFGKVKRSGKCLACEIKNIYLPLPEDYDPKIHNAKNG